MTDNEQTPVEKAAEALSERYKADKRTRVADARAAFESIDVTEMAQVVAARYWSQDTGEVEPWTGLTRAEQENVIENYCAQAIARAVRAWLLGEEG